VRYIQQAAEQVITNSITQTGLKRNLAKSTPLFDIDTGWAG